MLRFFDLHLFMVFGIAFMFLISLDYPYGSYWGIWLGVMVAIFGTFPLEFMIRLEADHWEFGAPKVCIYCGEKNNIYFPGGDQNHPICHGCIAMGRE